MTTFDGHVVSEAVQVPDASETTEDLLAGVTLIPLGNADDFFGGSHVRIYGEVYAYDDELTDNGEESGVPSITLLTGLVADVAEGTLVESWNPEARGGTGEVNCEWQVQVCPDAESEPAGHPATLAHTLIPMTSDAKPVAVGASVVVETGDDGSWLVVEIKGQTPGYDPAYFRTGTIQADVEITVGDPDGQRVNISGTDLIRAFNALGVQTVQINGATNYVVGTLATAESGPRIVLGNHDALHTYPAYLVAFESGDPDELDPAAVGYTTAAFDIGSPVPVLELLATSIGGSSRPRLRLYASTASEPLSVVELTDANLFWIAADEVQVNNTLRVGGYLFASMGDGSVGTGTFRDSVDARVQAGVDALLDGAPGALDTLNELAAAINDDASFAASVTTALAGKQPSNANLSALAGLTTAANKMTYWTGAGTAAVTDFTSFGLAIVGGATAAGIRTTILAKDKRPAVNTQTANYTIAATDEDVRVQINNAAARTVTLPSDTSAPTLPTNFEASVTRLGAGAVTFVADTGVTIDSKAGGLAITAQYGVVNIKKRASNRWILWGDI